MKKGGTMVLVVVTAMFVAFTAGMMFGRHFIREPVTVQPIRTENAAPSVSPANDNSSNSDGKININTAPAVLLDTLPGIGPVLAERIVDYRIENGPFESIEMLGEVEGIGSKTLLEILNLITVED